jgi:competence protein ComEA
MPTPGTSWMVVVLAALGGAAAGAAVVGLLVLMIGMGAEPDDGFAADIGEPLDPALGYAGGQQTLEGGLGRPAEPAGILIDVAGAVMRPGLHQLLAGDRVGDAIDAAGGFAPRVDLAVASQALNLAQPLQDGSKVLVPELGVDRVGRATADDGRIDINRAGQSELESLPGVGPVTARKIIEARSDGQFATVRDLRGRGIVGQALFEDLKDLIRVSG